MAALGLLGSGIPALLSGWHSSLMALVGARLGVLELSLFSELVPYLIILAAKTLRGFTFP